MSAVLRTHVRGRLAKLAATAAVGIVLVAGVTTSGTAQARDGHWGGGGHFGGGHWGGGHSWGHGGYWRGGWGPSWGLSIGFPAYPYYYDPYYYPRTVVVERPVYASPDYAWPVYNQEAYNSAMSAPIGQSASWDDGNSSGTVTTVREGHAGNRYCREFQQSVVIDGKRQQAFGAACQTPDGGWEIVPDNQ